MSVEIIVLTLSLLTTPSEANVFNSFFQWTMEWDSLINVFTLYKIIHWTQYRVTGFPILPLVKFPFLRATADDIPAKLRKQRFFIILTLASSH